MIKDFFDSFTDNIKEKTRNPFLGTYAIVWLIRNWYVVYMVFNFDKECTIDDKLRLITEYFERNPFWENIGYNILYTFGVLVATYLLLNLSRFIVNGFERNVTPLVYKITDKSSIVKKEDYYRIINSLEKVESNYELEKDRRRKAEDKNDALEKSILEVKEKSSDLLAIESKVKILDSENKHIRYEKERLIKDKDNLVLEVSELQNIVNSNKDLSSKFQELRKNFEEVNKRVLNEQVRNRYLEEKLLKSEEEIVDTEKLKIEIANEIEKFDAERRKVKMLNEQYSKAINEIRELRFKVGVLEKNK